VVEGYLSNLNNGEIIWVFLDSNVQSKSLIGQFTMNEDGTVTVIDNNSSPSS
jgi:TusA-related sulfurtransferase